MYWIWIGVFLLGAGVQFLQTRLTGWIVRRKTAKVTAIAIAAKALLWIGLVAGALHFSPWTLIAALAGSALCVFGYAIRHFLSNRKED